MPGSIAENLAQVRKRLALAEQAAHRPAGAVGLLAVSKTWPADAVRAAHAAGQCAFGENYVQEGVEKIAALQDLALEWHFIGPLQSNKSRLVAEQFDWVHSLDRVKLAERLAAQRPAEKGPLNVCLQVNVSGEASKSGVAPDEVLDLARAVAALPALRLRGLMCIPEAVPDAALLAQRFGTLVGLRALLQDALGLPLDTLSMGMSADLEVAVAAGSTLVRVGTAIFGSREYPQPA